MRFAYITPHVPLRRDFSADPLDAEWILAHRDDVAVWVDQEGPGTELLRSEGVSVTTSPQRSVHLPDHGRVSADHVQATLVADAHRREPFDAVVYGAGWTTDLAWLEPSLADLPMGVVLGGGVLDHVRLIADDARLGARYGRRCWAAATLPASADFLVSAASPVSRGLELGDKPVWDPSRAGNGGRSERPPAAPSLVAVVATSEDRAGLLRLLGRVVETVPVGPGTTLAVVAPDLPVGPERTTDLVIAGCPDGLETSTIAVAPGPDGVASELVGRADVVVAARASDAAIPAVRSSRRPVVTLTADPDPPADRLASIAGSDGEPRTLLVEVDGDLRSAATVLAGDSTSDVFVLHTPRAGVDAARFLSLRRASGFDLAVLGRAHPVFGTADPTQVSPELLAVSRFAVRPMLRWMERAGSLDELVGWVARTELAHRLRLAVLPAVATRSFRPTIDVDLADLPEWIGDSGVIPRIPVGGPSVDVDSLRAGRAPQVEKVPDVRAWVRERRWTDRARLALPWKGGLLSRAMRGRW